MWTKLFHFYEFAKEFFLFHMRYFDFLHFSKFSSKWDCPWHWFVLDRNYLFWGLQFFFITWFPLAVFPFIIAYKTRRNGILLRRCSHLFWFNDLFKFALFLSDKIHLCTMSGGCWKYLGIRFSYVHEHRIIFQPLYFWKGSFTILW